MPPASLPAFAAISPGPRTASSATRRPRGRRSDRHGVEMRRTSSVPQVEGATPAVRQHELEDVVDRDDAVQSLPTSARVAPSRCGSKCWQFGSSEPTAWICLQQLQLAEEPPLLQLLLLARRPRGVALELGGCALAPEGEGRKARTLHHVGATG